MKQAFQEMRRTLRRRDAVVVLLAAAVSVVGDAATMVALLLRAHASGHGPYAVTGLLVCFAAPVIALMGVAGSAADRLDARRTLVVCGVVQAVATLALIVVDGLLATYAVVLVVQSGFAMSQPVWTTVLPRVVDAPDVGRAVSLQQGLRGVAGPAGAALGGVLVQWRGEAAVFLLDAATFLLLALGGASLRLRDAELRPAAAAASGWARVLPTEGAGVLRRRPVLGVLVLALLPIIVFVEAVNAVEVFFLRDVLGVSATQFGLAEAISGGAAVLGALVAGGVRGARSRTRGILAVIGVLGLAQVGQGLAPAFVVYVVLGAVLGAGLGLVNALISALLLDEVEEGARGAVFALLNGAARAAGVVALVLGGTLGSTVGPRAAYVVVGVGGVVVSTVAAWQVRRRSPRVESVSSSPE